jgi:RND family efflux transporter MFP subunit
MSRVLFAAVVLIGASACSKEKPAAATPVAAATVEHKQAEAELTTITLTPEAIQRLGIKTETAQVQPAPGTRTLGGEVMVPEGRRVLVTAPVAGTLVSAGARAGATVAAGETLFRLTPLNASDRDQSSEARRAVEAAQAEEQVARQRVQRLEGLLKDGATSVRAVEEARAQLGVATAALNAARERLAAGSGSPVGPQGDITISAPFAGTVLAVSAGQGQTVAASAPLAEIGQVSTLWVKVPIYAGDAGTIDDRQPVAVSRLGTTMATLARRVTAPPSANANAASVDLFFEIMGNGVVAFRPGERVTVQLPLKSVEKGLAVPAAALLYDINGGTWVYQDMGSGAYARRRVEVARHAGSLALITRGIAEGTKVVTDGAAELFGTEFGVGH